MDTRRQNSLQTVTQFLENDENIKTLERLASSEWAGLSEKAHQNLGALGRMISRRERSGRSSSVTLIDPNLEIFNNIDEQCVCIPTNFRSEYEIWCKDWTSLFTVAGYSLRGSGDVLLKQYNFTHQIRHQTWKSSVCTRFLMLCYYNISLHDRGCETTAALIASGSDNIRLVLDALSDWIRIGERWNALCRDFGGYGAIFVLPEGIGDDTYMRIPLAGEKRRQIIAIIENLGIGKKVEDLRANELGLTICQNLLERRDREFYLPPWVSQKRQLQLVGRCTHPQQPEKRQRLECIDDDVKQLATLLSIFGRSDIPLKLFVRARNPYLSWGNDGEPIAKETDLVAVVKHEDKFQSAIEALQLRHAIQLSERAGQQYITIHPAVLETMVDDVDDRYKTEVVRLIFTAFPIDRRFMPVATYSIATSILPGLRHILPLLTKIELNNAFAPLHVVEVCLSATNYATLDQQNELVAAAEHIAAHYDVGDLTTKRIVLRRMDLSRMSSCEWDVNPPYIDFPRFDQKSNAYYGGYVVFVSHILIASGRFEAALHEIDKYQFWDRKKPSTLEKGPMYVANVLRGKILRFSGRFHEAKNFLLKTIPEEIGVSSILTTHLVAVCCELGETDFGIRYAERHLNDVTKLQPYECGNVRQLRLTLARAYLLESMWLVLAESVHNSWPKLQEDLNRAQELFVGLEASFSTLKTRTAKITRFSVQLSLAVLAHIRKAWQDALRLYETALEAAKDCRWKPGYIESVIHLSQSVILHQLGDIDEAQSRTAMAKALYSSPLNFFVGFGTLWPEFIGSCFDAQERERVIPQHSWERNRDPKVCTALA